MRCPEIPQSTTREPDLAQIEGVAGYYGAADVPGCNDLGAVVRDEEIFASKIVTCIGMPIGIVVADTEAAARAGARAVVVKYQDIPAVLSIEEAVAANSYFEVRGRRACTARPAGHKRAQGSLL